MRASKKSRNRNPNALTPNGVTRHEIQHQIVAEGWTGPLPPPSSLVEFDQVVPGTAQKIVEEWQAEAAHRRKFEKRALTAEVLERLGGRVLAFVFCILALATTIYLATLKAEWAAGLLGAGTIGSVAYALVHGQRRRDGD